MDFYMIIKNYKTTAKQENMGEFRHNGEETTQG